MKKGTSYIVVAAMVMGLILTGCGGSDNSDTTAASATTESVTEVATEEQDTEIQDTADDTEEIVRSPLMRRTQRKIQRTVKRQRLILQ